MRILIVEDDKNSADFLYKTLHSHAYDVQIARSYKEADEILQENLFSIILLDWNLGDGSGYDLLKELRSLDLQTSVIMITSEDDIEAKVAALDAGSDDYITKPYSSVELLARIRAISRREMSNKTSVINFDILELNTITHEIFLKGELLKLTKAEYDLLELFIQNPNVVLTRYQLSDHIMKDFASMSGSNLVDVHIKNIRKKLGDYNVIQTVRGVGYTLKEQ
ncbi:response regulator transcription factor [Sulfurimonas sp.]|uniref:response regulator transcription factor n=1 Tax=Sulfurimonas sp. TaxID=2022749 RepID=UPI003D145A2D